MHQKLKLYYNPFSGDKSFRYAVDACIHHFQKAGYETTVFRSMANGDIEANIAKTGKEYDAIVVSGGDGTINIVANAMLKHEVACPLGIIPSGTANDFAAFLRIPAEPEGAAQIIARNNILPIDMGQINGEQFFVNVCGAGLWTNISQQVDLTVKDTLGKLAYYLKGIEQLPNFVPFPVRITNSKQTVDESIYLFIALNSAGTGGFEKIAPFASIHDGLLDFVAIRARPLHEIVVLFFKMLTGSDFLNDINVIHFQDRYIKIEALEQNPLFHETDIDGETGPKLPVEICVRPKAIRIFVP